MNSRRSFPSWVILLVLLALAVQEHQPAILALVVQQPITTRTRTIQPQPQQQQRSSPSYLLFRRRKPLPPNHKHNNNLSDLHKQKTTTSALRMVLTTPESIIEQASTENLLDDLIDESVRTSARRPIMLQFDPSSRMIWKRWVGTVFSETWDACVSRMLYAAAVFFVCHSYPSIKKQLAGFNILWAQLLSVTTFTLTFFVNQSYALFRKCLELSRRLQGRLHDLDMTLAAHATRKPNPNAGPNEPSTYTSASKQLLELVSRYVRLFNLMTYASFTRSHRPILTPRGMRRMVERGLITATERQVLVDCDVPPTQRHNAILLWIIRVFVEGCEAGHFQGGAGFEEQFMEKIHVCRAQYGAIGDELQGRMPLAYAHLVQVLVDLVLWLYPFMAFASGFSATICVLGTGLLTLSYQGLADLAKQFLDPYDNESYGKGEDPLSVDTLIAETNAGSVRWMNGMEQFPVPSQCVVDGELSDFTLPVRGYTTEDLREQEEERLRKETEMQENREREELARQKQAEQERRLRNEAKALFNARIPNTTVAENIAETKRAFFSNNNSSSIFYGKEKDVKVAALALASISVNGDVGFRSVIQANQMLESLACSCEGFPAEIIPDGTAVRTENEIPKECVAFWPEGFGVDKDSSDNFVEATIADIDGGSSTATAAGEENAAILDEEVTFDETEAEEEVVDEGEEEQRPLQMFIGSEDGSSDDADDYQLIFDSFDPYKDLPWHDTVGPDGQEVRLSQMRADDEWEEELEAARQKEEAKIKTIEDYRKKIDELNYATKSEFLETQEILSASPNARGMKNGFEEEEEEEAYDQTKLDPISQLWGLPPDELSELRMRYEEAEASKAAAVREPTVGFDGVSQLWGNVDGDNNSGSRTSLTSATTSASAKSSPSSSGAPESDFSTISQLWGMSIGDDDNAAINGDSGGSLPPSVTRAIDDSPMPDAMLNKGELRLSQMLADEVYEEASEPRPPMEPLTFEDYTRQVAEVLEAEQEELRETAAILNAPPGADMVEDPVQNGDDSYYEKEIEDDIDTDNLSSSEKDSTVADEGASTAGTNDAGSIAMMDEDLGDDFDELVDDPLSSLIRQSWKTLPLGKQMANEGSDEKTETFVEATEDSLTAGDYAKQAEEILEAERQELLETEAILNAPPAAEFVDVKEREEPELIQKANTTDIGDENALNEEDLAVLEMDDPAKDENSKLSPSGEQTIVASDEASESVTSEQVNGKKSSPEDLDLIDISEEP